MSEYKKELDLLSEFEEKYGFEETITTIEEMDTANKMQLANAFKLSAECHVIPDASYESARLIRVLLKWASHKPVK